MTAKAWVGCSQDEWKESQLVAKKLHAVVEQSRGNHWHPSTLLQPRITSRLGRIYAAALGEQYYYDELREYTKDDNYVYTEEKINGGLLLPASLL